MEASLAGGYRFNKMATVAAYLYGDILLDLRQGIVGRSLFHN
jgi:hypothetical protein